MGYEVTTDLNRVTDDPTTLPGESEPPRQENVRA